MNRFRIDYVSGSEDVVQAYLRELPEPIFRFPLQERIIHERIGAASPVVADAAESY